MSGPRVSQQKIVAAAGNNSSLREVLQEIAGVSSQQQAVTGTSPKAVPAGRTSSSAPVPPQATGTVSVLKGVYVVELVNPGGTSPVSQVQAQLAAGSANALSPLQPVRTIYHQIRASTSAAFNVNSNTQVFGGNTGSAQVYWTLTGLGQGTWFIQFRSSYDGINFNTWRNANGGNALGALVNQVTEEAAANTGWILFTLPGGLLFGLGIGEVPDQQTVGLPQGLYSSGLLGIAGPNGFPSQSNGVSGLALSDVDILIPSTGLQGVSGIPDFPVQIRCLMNTADNDSQVASNATLLLVAFDPSNPNVLLYAE